MPTSTTPGTPTTSTTVTETPTASSTSTGTTTETPTPTPSTYSTTTSTQTPSPTPTTSTETPTPSSTTRETPPSPPSSSTTTTTETASPTPTITTTTRPESATPTGTVPGSPPGSSPPTSPSPSPSSTRATTTPAGEETPSTPPVTTRGSTPPPPTPGSTPPGPPTSGPASSTPTPTAVRTSTTGAPTPGRPSTTAPASSTAASSTAASSAPAPTLTPTPVPPPSISMSTGTGPSTATQIYCCEVNGTYYAPGELVYNGTHGNTCYYVNCSLDCDIQIFNWSCPSTPTPTPGPTPTPASSPSPPTPPKPPGTAPPGCPDFDPPRQENETWWLCNCTQAVCKHGNTVELVEVECEPPPMPTCSNNLAPVRVMDPDGCCWHWECDCYCSGWGDPHFVTFDGLYYSYQGNCTYVLVEEITPKVDNFGVYIDNYHCDPSDQVSCPRTIIVRHETQEVLLKTVQMQPLRVQVQVNGQAVALPYRKYGLEVSASGINYVVSIPELGAVINYNGLAFSVRLPFSLFGHNTKGQCGTCSNSTADDCMLPSGELAADCEVAADQWVVNDPSKPHCPQAGSTTRRPATTTPGGSSPPGQSCGSPLCELILQSPFAACHAAAPPRHYHEACVFDSCFVPGAGLECASLQTYAALCAQQGVCVDWRNLTGGACAVTCPSHREYRACGPAEEPTCKTSPPPQNGSAVEGCFCPEGTTSYAPGFDVCVEACGCVGPDNVPREFGEHFEFDCKECVCLEGGSGIMCHPKTCRGRSAPTCAEDGTYPATEVDPADTCCNVTTCKCNVSLCREQPHSCPLGFEAKSEMVPGGAARSTPAVMPKGVCVVDSAEYQPGSPVYSSKCMSCQCTSQRNSTTQLHVVACSRVPCTATCSPGFELVAVPGECCGKCQQTRCVIHRPGGQYLVLKVRWARERPWGPPGPRGTAGWPASDPSVTASPGSRLPTREVKSDPGSNCTFFSCVKIHNQLISSVSNITCPSFDPSDCVPGTITLAPNGCCKTCTSRNETRVPCSTIPVTKEISHAGCVANVTTNYCAGSCGTFAMYSAEAQALDRRCSCCKEERTRQREVTLRCPTGGLLAHTFTHIESCQCQDSSCAPLPARRTRRGAQQKRVVTGLHQNPMNPKTKQGSPASPKCQQAAPKGSVAVRAAGL
ncbi:intestinal mucin-like protein [Talpa occidentalis]|uniref:intestinal mucin-like protein n=1 Tax=Talpa occidentalis TaxID=50954 RepID=UPI00188EFB76|nr:intestinal mucin-like protein [Talpa occidentalis]